MKTLTTLVTAFVLSGLLISMPTSAAPDGSLRKMLDTKITLIEYIELRTKLRSVERLATGVVTEWGDYTSVVRLHTVFDHDDSELTFWLNPEDDHYFSTIAEAKSYCRDLIRKERLEVWLLLVVYSTPSGWTTDSLDTDEFQKKLYQSAKIVTALGREQVEEQLPEEEHVLRCEASLDDKGQVKNFSYNL